MIDNKTVSKLISFFLNGVLDYIRKAPNFQCRPTDQGSIHVALAHQLPGIAGFNTPTILNPHPPGCGLIEHRSEHQADERMGFLGLSSGGSLTRPDGPN